MHNVFEQVQFYEPVLQDLMKIEKNPYPDEIYYHTYMNRYRYGSVWMNQGYNWMLYDAIFPRSQYDIMNCNDIYTDRMFLTSYYGNLRAF